MRQIKKRSATITLAKKKKNKTNRTLRIRRGEQDLFRWLTGRDRYIGHVDFLNSFGEKTQIKF